MPPAPPIPPPMSPPPKPPPPPPPPPRLMALACALFLEALNLGRVMLGAALPAALLRGSEPLGDGTHPSSFALWPTLLDLRALDDRSCSGHAARRGVAVAAFASGSSAKSPAGQAVGCSLGRNATVRGSRPETARLALAERINRGSPRVAAACQGRRSGTASDRASPGACSSSLAGARSLARRRPQRSEGISAPIHAGAGAGVSSVRTSSRSISTPSASATGRLKLRHLDCALLTLPAARREATTHTSGECARPWPDRRSTAWLSTARERHRPAAQPRAPPRTAQVSVASAGS